MQLEVKVAETPYRLPIVEAGRYTKKKRDDDNKSTDSQIAIRLPYCGGCGHKHANADVNFCSNCGMQRDSPCSDVRAAAAATDQAAATDAATTTTTMTAAATTTTTMTAAATTTATTKRGREDKLQKLRCGWSICGDTFVSPDGEKFQNRKEESKYSNKDVPMLEPVRQDGWQVFIDATDTHVTWIAPDGQKLNSFVSAKAYAQSCSLPIYGKDGRTKSIACFFEQKKAVATGKSSTDTIIDMTTTTKTSHIQPHVQKPANTHQDVEPVKPPKKVRRKFVIPKQSSEAVAMQKLLRTSAILRNARKTVKADAVEKQYTTLYTLQRQISDNMATKVCTCLYIFYIIN